MNGLTICLSEQGRLPPSKSTNVYRAAFYHARHVEMETRITGGVQGLSSNYFFELQMIQTILIQHTRFVDFLFHSVHSLFMPMDIRFGM